MVCVLELMIWVTRAPVMPSPAASVDSRRDDRDGDAGRRWLIGGFGRGVGLAGEAGAEHERGDEQQAGERGLHDRLHLRGKG